MRLINLNDYRRPHPPRPPTCVQRPAPPPHAPADRIEVDTSVTSFDSPVLCTWQVRIFDPAGQFHLYCGTTGFAHIQLWNPWFGVSLLTPSRLTASRYEAFPIAGWKYACDDYADIVYVIEKMYATIMPSAARVIALCEDYGALPTGDRRKA